MGKTKAKEKPPKRFLKFLRIDPVLQKLLITFTVSNPLPLQNPSCINNIPGQFALLPAEALLLGPGLEFFENSCVDLWLMLDKLVLG